MFSRSSNKRNRVAVVPATVEIIKPEKDENTKEAIDLSKATITIIKPKKSGLKIIKKKVKEEGEEDE